MINVIKRGKEGNKEKEGRKRVPLELVEGLAGDFRGEVNDGLGESNSGSIAILNIKIK